MTPRAAAPMPGLAPHRVPRWPAVIGATALVAVGLGAHVDRAAAAAAWLAAWWFCIGVALGAAANQRIHRLTGGRWGETIAPASRALQRPLPWLLPLALPLLASRTELYAWTRGSDWADGLHRPAFVQAWFGQTFVVLRLIAYGLAWWWLTRRPATSTKTAAIGLAMYTLVTSAAVADVVMSLQPHWSSSGFGWLVLAAQLGIGASGAVALAAAGAAWPQRAVVAAGPSAPADPHAPPVWRDLGNLLLMNVMLQAYLQFMQFLVIWAENLPREIAWYVPRLQTGWRWIGLAVVLTQFALPFVALLWRRAKDDPRRLAVLAAALLAAQALGTVWLIVPSVTTDLVAAAWLVPLAMGGMVLLQFGHLLPACRRAGDRDG